MILPIHLGHCSLTGFQARKFSQLFSQLRLEFETAFSEGYNVLLKSEDLHLCFNRETHALAVDNLFLQLFDSRLLFSHPPAFNLFFRKEGPFVDCPLGWIRIRPQMLLAEIASAIILVRSIAPLIFTNDLDIKGTPDTRVIIEDTP